MNLRLDRPSHSQELGVLEEIYQTAPKPPAPRRTAADYQAQVVILSLGAITLAVLGLGWQQLTHDFLQPRRQLLAAATAIPDNNAATTASTQDTDGDGLTDHEEQLIGTSAYLEDTDSDGIGDAQEVAAKTNPTCAEGGLCQLLPQTQTLEDAGERPVVAASTSSDLRARIAELGVPANFTASLSDDELERIFAEVVASAPASGATTASEGSREATPTRLREWLSQQGVDPKLLEGISDAELAALAQEATQAPASQ